MLIADVNNCVLWSGSQSKAGYGRINRNGRVQLVHRWTWEQHNGTIPAHHEIHHLCEVKNCYNINHLECIDSTQHRIYHGARGACLVNREKQTCSKGHDYDKIYIDSKGREQRKCSVCHNERNRKYKTRKFLKCSKGHEFDRQYIDKNGRIIRGCSICRHEVAVKRAESRWSQF